MLGVVAYNLAYLLRRLVLPVAMTGSLFRLIPGAHRATRLASHVRTVDRADTGIWIIAGSRCLRNVERVVGNFG